MQITEDERIVEVNSVYVKFLVSHNLKTLLNLNNYTSARAENCNQGRGLESNADIRGAGKCSL